MILLKYWIMETQFKNTYWLVVSLPTTTIKLMSVSEIHFLLRTLI